MFSRAEKQRIAAAVEAVIREINHPEMDNDHIRFHLYVDGRSPLSWAEIGPNWAHADAVNPNPWNEVARDVLEGHADA